MQINSEFQFQDTLKWELQGFLQEFSQSVSQISFALQEVILRGEW